MGTFAESSPFLSQLKNTFNGTQLMRTLMTPSNMRDYRSRRLSLVTWSTFEAIDLIENLPALSKDQQVIDVVPEKTEIRIGFDQNKYKHRFDKTLSDSQKKVIQDMSVKSGINISIFFRKMFNIEFKEIFSYQAHDNVQHLKDPNKKLIH